MQFNNDFKELRAKINDEIKWNNAKWAIAVLLVILVILLTVILTHQVIYPAKLLSALSAFATILSIILSIVAIAVTFHSTYETSRHVEDITNKAQQLQNVVSANAWENTSANTSPRNNVNNGDDDDGNKLN